jgi:hypothetical protein
MYFCSGQPMHFCSGVDTLRRNRARDPESAWRSRQVGGAVARERLRDASEAFKRLLLPATASTRPERCSPPTARAPSALDDPTAGAGSWLSGCRERRDKKRRGRELGGLEGAMRTLPLATQLTRSHYASSLDKPRVLKLLESSCNHFISHSCILRSRLSSRGGTLQPSSPALVRPTSVSPFAVAEVVGYDNRCSWRNRQTHRRTF